MDKEYNQVLNIYSVFKPQKKKKRELRGLGFKLNREDIHWRAGSDGVCLVGKEDHGELLYVPVMWEMAMAVHLLYSHFSNLA